MSRTSPPRLVRLSGAMVAFAAFLSGCAQGGAQEESPVEDYSFEAIVQSALQDAHDSNASQAQIDLLHDALDTGEMTFEAAAQARDATLKCLRDLGLDARAEDQENQWGWVLPFWSVASDSPAPVETCELQESMWVSQVYQTQPAAHGARDAWILERSPQLRDCLEQGGITLNDDATVAELLSATSDMWSQTDGEVDCAAEIGLHSY